MHSLFNLKRIFVISIITIVLAILISCNKQPKAVHYCTLILNCDSTFNEHIYENVYLISDSDTIYVDGKNYRQKKTGIKIKLDSIPSKEYVLCLSDLFSNLQSQKLNLKNDTVIKISNLHKYENCNIISLEELGKADTLKLFYSYSGCSSHVESFNLIKKNHVYLLEPIRVKFGKRIMYTPYISKTVSKKIVKGLYELQIKSRRYMVSVRNKKTPWHTIRQEYYILVNNKFFRFDDENRYCEEYYRFSEKFIQ